MMAPGAHARGLGNPVHGPGGAGGLPRPRVPPGPILHPGEALHHTSFITKPSKIPPAYAGWKTAAGATGNGPVVRPVMMLAGVMNSDATSRPRSISGPPTNVVSMIAPPGVYLVQKASTRPGIGMTEGKSGETVYP